MGGRRLPVPAAVSRTRASAARRVLGVALGAHAREAVALALLAGRVDAVELDARVRLPG